MSTMNEVLGGQMSQRKFRKSLFSGVALSVMLAGASEAAAQAVAPADSATQEVIVTAQRRSQNLQDVPIAIEAVSAAQLKNLNVENFDDLVATLPAVTLAGFGPGQNNVYMRGLSVGGDEGGQGGGGVGSFPNVAIFLDEQSAQVPGKNLDLYAADLQRIEVLEGPQGTLFGSGAQAGVVRYITNKPDLTKFGLAVNAGAADTAHGAMSENVDAMINVPLIEDKLGVRLVIYDDSRGGYIKNVAGTLSRQSTDLGIPRYAGYTNNVPGPATPTNSINNNNIAGKNINPVTYQGGRVEALWQIDNNWNVLLSESVQNLDAEGVFYEMPYTSGSNPVKLPDLSVQLFEPSSDRDFFENTALTINGRLGSLNVVYSGAYLVRNTTQIQDYTNYARGIYADYYQCTPANAKLNVPQSQCYSPGATWQDIEHDTHLSQELRFSTPDSWRLRAVGGLFYEDFEVQDRTNYNYLTAPGFVPIGPPAGSTAIDPNVRSSSTAFFNDITRGYTQYAAFASIDYDIIPHVLTATVGTRYFDFENFEKGSAVSSFGCYIGNVAYTGPAQCATEGATNIDAEHLKSTNTGFNSRANLTWNIKPDIMVYYTFSQGYRPDGFNRKPPQTKTFVGQDGYQSDTLTNNEIGYKTQFFHRHLTINGAFYQEDWNNVQDRLFDPGAFGNLAFTVNGPNYRVRGTEVQVTAIPIDGLTINGGLSLNQSRQLTSPPIYSVTGVALPGSAGIFGAIGDTLAQSPDVKGDIRARYEFNYGEYRPFAQIGVNYSSRQHSSVSNYHNFEEASITTVNASIGVRRDSWSATAYVENLTDERGQEFISAAQFVQSIVVNRPLTAGLKFSYTQ